MSRISSTPMCERGAYCHIPCPGCPGGPSLAVIEAAAARLMERASMSDYQTRLFEEHSDLRRKIEKLKLFICGDTYETLPEVDRKDLKEQLKHMEAYFVVLSRRTSRLCGGA